MHMKRRSWRAAAPAPWCLVIGIWMLVAEPSIVCAATAAPVLGAMEAELNRPMTALAGQPQPPYFLSYMITEIDKTEVTAEFGALTQSVSNRDRLLRVDLRVGDYNLDSSHQIRGDPMSEMLDRYSFVKIPLEDDADAIRGVLWYQTDRAYKRALQKLATVKTQVQVKVAEEDRSPDFSRDEAASSVEDIPPFAVDRGAWEEKLRRYTEPFAKHGEIYQADAKLSAVREVRWFASSEGARIQTAQISYKLSIVAATKAEDGMELPLNESFFSFTPEGMPDDAVVLARVDEMIRNLLALRAAPVVDPYTGPAILSGRASSVFFHEIFGHRVEGHRQRSEDEGQTFRKMVGKEVLPASFSVIFDPTVTRLAGTDLAGSYRFDDEGVRSRPVTVVEKGILRSFLMSRKPIEGFPVSNGHARCQPGLAPVSRQSNLIVQVDRPVTSAALKKMLLERIKKEGKAYGLFFDDIVGGFTMTGRTTPNAFNVIPTIVYRIFPDGREELVRGVDLIGTPLTAFSRIAAGDDQLAVFNGTCGAESGGVPASCISPAILVDQIEVQKKEKSQERPPLLPAPKRGSLGR
jgi:TldD protein